MAEVSTANLKFSLKDVVSLVGVVVTVITNYYVLKSMITSSELNQAKNNAVYELRLQTLEVQVSKMDVEIKELKDKQLIERK